MPRKKKCKECKQQFEPQRPMQVCCGWTCAAAYGRKQNEKSRLRQEQRKAKKERELKALDRKRLEELKPRSQWLREAQKAVNTYIRTRDIKKGCISCGMSLGDKFDAGHFRTVARAAHIRFHLLNINGQCVACNQHLSGNLLEYRKGMIARYGVERTEWIENINFERRYTIEEAKRIKQIFNKRTRLYKRLFR